MLYELDEQGLLRCNKTDSLSSQVKAFQWFPSSTADPFLTVQTVLPVLTDTLDHGELHTRKPTRNGGRGASNVPVSNEWAGARSAPAGTTW